MEKSASLFDRLPLEQKLNVAKELKQDYRSYFGEHLLNTIAPAIGALILSAISFGLANNATALTPVPEKKYLASAGIYAENYKGDAPLDVLDQIYQTIEVADLESRLQPTTEEANGSTSTIIRPGSEKTLEEISVIENACKYKPDYSKTSLDKETIKKMETIYVNNLGRNLKNTAYDIEEKGGYIFGSVVTALGAIGLGLTSMFYGILSGFDAAEWIKYAKEEKIFLVSNFSSVITLSPLVSF